MKMIVTLSGAAVLLAANAASAQELPGQPAGDPAAAELSTEADAAAQFSDAEIAGFAEAMLGIRELQADSALDATAKQEQAGAIVAEAGIDPRTFNAIGQAMQSDPEIAQRVQLAVAARQGDPEG